MTKDEIIKLALDALDKYGFAPCDKDEDWQGFKKTIAALRQQISEGGQAHKPHEECECNACLNYFTTKAFECAQLMKRLEEDNAAYLKNRDEQAEQPTNYERLRELGWQRVACPACGSDMAVAQPKAEQRSDSEQLEPVAFIERLKAAENAIESIKNAAIPRGGWSKTHEKCEEALSLISHAVATYQEDVTSCAYISGYTEAFEKYAAHPRREWVSLSDDEIFNCFNGRNGVCVDIARAIEAKLKEKNHD